MRKNRKIPVTGIRTRDPTCQKVTRVPTELRGRPAVYCKYKQTTANRHRVNPEFISDQTIAYQWRSLPRVRRHRISCPKGSSSNNWCSLFRYHHGPISVRLSFSKDIIRHLCIGSVQSVCVFFPSILDIKFVGRTSRGHTGGRSHRIFNPPSFCGACLDFCREKDSAIPFPRRP